MATSGLCSANSFFAERDAVLEDVAGMISTADASAAAILGTRVATVLDRYQEQPHLLDPSLPAIVGPLMQKCRELLRLSVEKEDGVSGRAFPLQVQQGAAYLQCLFSVVYRCCKVRGYKAILRHFPHEVADLEPVFNCLLSQDTESSRSCWETSYVLLLWLSVLVLVPFDLQSVDSASARTGAGGGEEKLVSRLISAFKLLLADPGKSRDAAAICIARLLSRPDLDSDNLRSFLEWANTALEICFEKEGNTRPVVAAPGDVSAVAAAGRSAESAFAATAAARLGLPLGSVTGSSRSFLATGVLQALVEIAKHGHRHSLLAVLQESLSRILAIVGGANDDDDAAPAAAAGGAGGSGGSGGSPMRASVLLRKLIIKLAARTALQYLPPRLAHWRYQRARRTLLFKEGASNTPSSNAASPAAGAGAGANKNDTDDDDPDVPVEVESTLDMLLVGLRDSDTIVRWSAAKGLGRVTGRLPLSYGDDVVQAVLDCLTPAETDASWHGGCLALAELARRGLLLPVRLELAVPRLLSALQYDIRRGAHSIGAHVRDAACYVCWAFARAYDPTVLRPHVLPLARGMIITALFDREVNCRRAASAAFQEHVGRQGGENIPDGIAVLTLADYHSLGNRKHSFLDVAPKVAAFPAYRYALLEHLLSTKLKHWDKDIRILAAESLGLMAGTDSSWFKATALPTLLGQITSQDLFARHGAILAIAEVCLGLSRVPTLLHPSLLDPIRNVVVKAEKARVYTGRGGEMVRMSVCRLIAAQCLADHPISRKAALRFLQTVDDCLKHPNESVQEEALGALRAIGSLPTTNDYEDASLLQRLPQTYILKLNTDDNPAVRRGMGLAIGALPRSLLCSPLPLNKADVAHHAPPVAPGTASAGGSAVAASDAASAADADSASTTTTTTTTISVLDAALDSLILATKQEKQVVKRDAETRRNAVIGLVELVCNVGFCSRRLLGDAAAIDSTSHGDTIARHVSEELLSGLSAAQLHRAWDALHAATFDYATDNRGDVGSWVRKAALEGMEKVVAAISQAVSTHEAATSSSVSSLALTAATPSLVASVLQHHDKHRGRHHHRSHHLHQGKAGGGHPALGSRLGLFTSNGLPLGAEVVAKGHSGATGLAGRVTKVVGGGLVCEVSGLASPSFPYGSALIRASELALRSINSTSSSSFSPSTTVAVQIDDVGAAALKSFLADRGRMSEQLVGAALRTACEKLDLLRGLASEVLGRLPPPGSVASAGVAHAEALQRAFFVSLSGNAGEHVEDDDADSDGEGDGGGGADVAGGGAGPSESLPLSLNAAEEANVFAKVIPLLACEAPADEDDDDRFIYSQHILAGLVTAVGGLSESVVKQASRALCDWCLRVCEAGDHAAVATVAKKISTFLHARPLRLWDLFVDGAGSSSNSLGMGVGSAEPHDVAMAKWFKQILGVSSGVSSSATASSSSSGGRGTKLDNRLITPAIKTLEVIVRSDAVLSSLATHSPSLLEEVVKSAASRAYASSEDAARISAVADLCLTLLGLPEGSASSGASAASALLLLDVLGHPFPKLRRQTAEKLYVRLLTVGLPSSSSSSAVYAAGSCAVDDALELLTTTAWDGPLEGILGQRDRLYPLIMGMGITSLPEKRSGSAVAGAVFSIGSDGGAASFGAGGAGGRGVRGTGGAGGTMMTMGEEIVDEGYGNLVKDAGY